MCWSERTFICCAGGLGWRRRTSKISGEGIPVHGSLRGRKSQARRGFFSLRERSFAPLGLAVDLPLPPLTRWAVFFRRFAAGAVVGGTVHDHLSTTKSRTASGGQPRACPEPSRRGGCPHILSVASRFGIALLQKIPVLVSSKTEGQGRGALGESELWVIEAGILAVRGVTGLAATEVAGRNRLAVALVC